MTLFTFYSQGNDGQVHIEGTLDNATGEYSGDGAKTLKSMIAASEIDITDEDKLLEAFYDGSRLWIRKGEPFGPLVEREAQGAKKTPTVTFSRFNDTG